MVDSVFCFFLGPRSFEEDFLSTESSRERLLFVEEDLVRTARFSFLGVTS